MKKLFVLLFSISILVFLTVSCGPYNSAAKEKNVKMDLCSTKENIVDYYNGVYYFNCLESDFANALSQFIGEHPELKLITMTGNMTTPSGSKSGYFVIFEKRENTQRIP